jgi:hypothetical protein
MSVTTQIDSNGPVLQPDILRKIPARHVTVLSTCCQGEWIELPGVPRQVIWYVSEARRTQLGALLSNMEIVAARQAVYWKKSCQTKSSVLSASNASSRLVCEISAYT